VDRDLLSTVAHRWHPIAAPLSDDSVRRLIRRAGVGPGARAVDLGCGPGAWGAAVVAEQPEARVVGVDLSPSALQAARAAATEKGLTDRTEWVEADASSWRGGRFDLVLAVGVSHVFGGLEGTLAAIRRHLASGGRAILGDGVWEAPPSRAAQDVLEAGPDEFPDVAGLVAAARAHGLATSYGHVSTPAEWDEYEWCWTGALTQWALAEADNAEARQEALRIADEHRTGWLTGYRGELGFACLVLHDVTGS
jgi:SAM-dependent methyltransferase